ncbi:MAG: radical SAM protein [Candidatus Altiarchaeales archaeon]|nr:radical SAM protein [Candidatus Altiarchaeales archaeon]MBD3416649.1 radical SAM protein [Candidatus Altiarchaeales archaeon]
MRVLFINPPDENMIDTEVPEILSRSRGCNPQLGMLYLASSLVWAGHEVEVVDAQVEGLGYGDIRKRIVRSSPDVLGLSAMSFTLIDSLLTAEMAKEADPEVRVVMGGPHPTIYPVETASLEHVDVAVSGEGEHTMVEVVDRFERCKPLKDVRGISYVECGRVVENGMSPFIEDLDSLPFPARELTPYRKYTSLLAKRSPITTLFSSRGCPYRCLFCDRPQMGKRFRARSASNVVDEMEECVGMGIREFLVYDDTFTVDRQRVLDICFEIRDRGLDIGWDIRARADSVDREMLSTLSRSGCERIHYGVESGNQGVLDTLCKGITLRQAEDAFRWASEAGIETLAYFIIGSPGETLKTFDETLDFALKLDPDFAHFSLMTPFPATDLYRLGLERGVIGEDYWRKFAESPSPGFRPPVWEEDLGRDQLVDLMKSAYKRFYLRPYYILERVRRVRSAGEMARKLRAGLRVIGM